MIIFTDKKSAVAPLENVVYSAIEKYSPKAIYFRDKYISDDEYLDIAKKLKLICEKFDMQFYICHRVEIARVLGVRNLHINLNNISKIGTKTNFDNISVAIHSLEEVEKAQNLGATSLVFGHIFETSCKSGLAPRGIHQLKEICRSSQVPVVAIGGINRGNCNQVLEVGVADFAIMSSAMTLTF